MSTCSPSGHRLPRASQVSEEIKQAARLTAAHFATDADELVMFMKMLGIHPSQDADELDVQSGYIPHTPPRSGWR